MAMKLIPVSFDENGMHIAGVPVTWDNERNSFWLQLSKTPREYRSLEECRRAVTKSRRRKKIPLDIPCQALTFAPFDYEVMEVVQIVGLTRVRYSSRRDVLIKRKDGTVETAYQNQLYKDTSKNRWLFGRLKKLRKDRDNLDKEIDRTDRKLKNLELPKVEE